MQSIRPARNFSFTFHSLQKNTTLRHSYKRLEEEHYKAQEKIQLLQGQSKRSSLAGNDEMPTASSTLFRCEQCTKNFLSEELLRAHTNRKHNARECPDQQHEKLQSELKQLKEKMNAAEKEIFQIDSSNDNNESAATMTKAKSESVLAAQTVCSTCSKKSETVVSSVAVQCEDEKTLEQVQPSNAVDVSHVEAQQIPNKPNEIPVESAITSAPSNAHEQTIAELKAEVTELQNALRKKFVEEQVANERETSENMVSASDKIVVIEQRFTEFETKYEQSQHEFIESFRNLDERINKNYINDIHDTIKEIVEKSLGRYDTPAGNAAPTTTMATTAQVHENGTNDTVVVAEARPASRTEKVDPKMELIDDDQSSESMSTGDDASAEKPAIEIQKASPRPEVRPKSAARRPSKADAVNEFESRLHQIGVDTNVPGLSTPHTAEVAKELAEERAEIKKAHKSFASTRNKLNSEVERIAKAKMTSASSVTSLSSHRTDDDNDIDDDATSQEDHGNVKRRKNVRPKSAKREPGNVLRKFVSNDIDESDLMGKMKMAQKAIDAHRECIQELLQTTAHSPKTMAPPSATASTTKHSTNAAKESTPDDESNRYNKMPNVTTRRVVFVNLDEDS